jgi:malonyl-CoA/methylmalonyl-CoA synthetase
MSKFPNDPIFASLLQLRQSVQGVLIHDDYGVDAGPNELLDNICRLRETLRRELPTGWFDARGLLRPDTGRIASISVSGYYFLVGFFAIAALGGTCVSLRESISQQRERAKVTEGCH